MITVFYDGMCGLCSKEINYYRRVAPPVIFRWQDITKDRSELEKIGVSYAEGLKLLHVQDANGALHVGIDAFIMIWRQMRGWRFLAILTAVPIIRQLAGSAYRLFAQWRFNRLAHCKLAQQERNAQ